jgi:carbon storage regulator
VVVILRCRTNRTKPSAIGLLRIGKGISGCAAIVRRGVKTTERNLTMLVLSRKVGERIQIDADIYVEVLEAKPDKVRLGITAPQAVRIYRQELLTKEEEYERAK